MCYMRTYCYHYTQSSPCAHFYSLKPCIWSFFFLYPLNLNIVKYTKITMFILLVPPPLENLLVDFIKSALRITQSDFSALLVLLYLLVLPLPMLILIVLHIFRSPSILSTLLQCPCLLSNVHRWLFPFKTNYSYFIQTLCWRASRHNFSLSP